MNNNNNNLETKINPDVKHKNNKSSVSKNNLMTNTNIDLKYLSFYFFPLIQLSTFDFSRLSSSV